MIYVQYFEKSAISNELIHACGDRAVVILDGRETMTTHKTDAIAMNGVRRPVYQAFQIFKGDAFSRSEPLTRIIPL